MDSFSRARMPDLATTDTKHTVINVDTNSSDGPQLPPLDVKSVIIITIIIISYCGGFLWSTS